MGIMPQRLVQIQRYHSKGEPTVLVQLVMVQRYGGMVAPSSGTVTIDTMVVRLIRCSVYIRGRLVLNCNCRK
jgi:hypothetical protein